MPPRTSTIPIEPTRDVGSLEEPSTPDLRNLVVRGLKWKLFSQISLQTTRLAVGIVLARILAPHEFGVAAMALVLSGFIVPFADIGMGAALVQRRSITDDDRSTVFWASVGSGVVLTTTVILVAPAVGNFYGNQRVAPLLAVLSLGFIITALGSTHRSLLARSMNFRSLEVRYALASFAGGGTAIGLAAAHFGAWAFIGQELVLSTISTLLLWLVLPWKPDFRFSINSLRNLGGFGARALGGAFFNNLNRNTDNLLIGKFIGAGALGLYAFAYNLMLAPLSRVVAPIQQVFFPALSRLQDDPRRLASSWLRANRVIAAICTPPLAIVIVTAPDLVPLVFGEHWRPAVRVVQILCWVGILQCLQALNDSVLQAGNAIKLYVRFTGISFAVNVVAFVIGLHWGILGVASAFAMSSTLIAVAYTILVTKQIGMSAGSLVRGFAGVAQALCGMVLAAVGVWTLLGSASASPVIRLLATIAAAVVVYLPLLAWREPAILSEVRRAVSGRRDMANGSLRPPIAVGDVETSL